jgi:hypothetical protein
MKISACGLFCNECSFYTIECDGCFQVKGKTFWAADHTAKGVCPIFDCSINEKKFKSCGDCEELPCNIFTQLKDPNISDSEHQMFIQKRVAALRGLK